MISSISEALGGVSDGVVYALLALGAVQVGVQVWALVDLVRRERVAGGRKWVWALVIVAVSNLALGAVLYLAIGRRVPDALEAPSPAEEPARDRAQRAVDVLYGDSGEETR